MENSAIVKRYCLIVMAVMVSVICLGGVALAADRISEAEATAIAIDHAGVNKSDVRVVEFKLYRQRGVFMYDIEFVSDKVRYDYEINAETGEIVEFHRDERHDVDDEYRKNPDNYIGTEKAKSIAFEHAGVDASKVYKLEVDMDREKGRVLYEVDFKYDGWEYEYEIDARTGGIIRWDRERD